MTEMSLYHHLSFLSSYLFILIHAITDIMKGNCILVSRLKITQYNINTFLNRIINSSKSIKKQQKTSRFSCEILCYFSVASLIFMLLVPIADNYTQKDIAIILQLLIIFML